MKALYTLFIGVVIMVTLASCHLVEVNMVQRSTLSDGETIKTSQHDTTIDRDEATMELIVPIK